MNRKAINTRLARRTGFALIPSRGEPIEECCGLLGRWIWLYPDGTHHREIPNFTQFWDDDLCLAIERFLDEAENNGN